jgi:hypothetical protein
MRLAALAAPIALLVLMEGAEARAADCPAPPGAPALASVDAEARIRFLASAFDREVRDVDLWSWSWGSIYVAAGGAQAIAAALTHDHGLRVDVTVGAVSAGIGALSLYGLPLRVTLPLRDAGRDRMGNDRCRVLAEYEATLESVASTQRLSGGWVPHVGNVLFNVGLALVLGWGFGRWKSAAISAGVGVVVGEANVLTQPHRMPGVLDRYRAGHLEDADDRGPSPSMAFVAGGHAMGVGWQLRF